jgi:outer membrane protein TolC
MVSQKASYARAQIQFEQSKAQLKSLQLNLYADVTNAGLAVQNAYLRYLAAQKSRDAQEKNTAAAQTRFDNGMSTPFEVATAIQNLTSARLAELNAVITYLNAVAEFERKQRVGG